MHGPDLTLDGLVTVEVKGAYATKKTKTFRAERIYLRMFKEQPSCP